MIKVRFSSADTPFVLKQKKKTSAFLSEILLLEKKTAGTIHYIFCSDLYLLRLNEQFLGHHDFTDILTFEDYNDKKQLSAEIYISIERVAENAIARKLTFHEELLRVMIHGVLHIGGYKDGIRAEKKEMRAKEDYYIERLNTFVSRET